MASAPLRTLLLAATLAAAVPAFAESDQAGPRSGATDFRAVDASQASPAVRAEADTESGPAYPTLGAMALGVLGLLWVRRHTAEL